MNIKVIINEKWNWSNVGLSTLAGFAIGGSFGALNGLIMEERYQRQLDKGRVTSLQILKQQRCGIFGGMGIIMPI